LSPAGQKRCCKTSENEEDSFSASTKKPNVEKEHVWHHENCHSCKALQRIEEKHMARLQHHFKFCDVYSVYYRTIKSVAAIIQLPERINPEIHFLHQEQAKEIWTLASQQMKSKENPQLFECAVEMSSQFLGPAETATFNCEGLGQECIFFPEEYKFRCHGQK
jgi:hypothetical protein